MPLASVAALFENEAGFFALRTVRSMFFIDFRSIGEANVAMRKRQNHRFPGVKKPLLIDYDRDDPSKRERQFHKQLGREIQDSEAAEVVELQCAACSTFCLKLRIRP